MLKYLYHLFFKKRGAVKSSTFDPKTQDWQEWSNNNTPYNPLQKTCKCPCTKNLKPGDLFHCPICGARGGMCIITGGAGSVAGVGGPIQFSVVNYHKKSESEC